MVETNNENERFDTMQVIKITNNTELEKAFSIRKKVFVEEQKVPLADEFDTFDNLQASCDHILVLHEEQAVGTGRLRVVDGVGKLERICILPSKRQYGFGKSIIAKLEELAKGKSLTRVKLHAQTQAEGFYQKLGYTTNSDVFMEDGIPHIIMTKEI